MSDENIVSIKKKSFALGAFIFGTFVALQAFVWYRMHSVDENTDIFYENMILFAFIMVANIAINVALTMFTNKIVFNLESLKHGVSSFFDYLNRKNDHVSEVAAKGNDEFKVIAKMVNENVESIEKELDNDRAIVKEVGSVISKVAKGDYSQRIKQVASNPEIKQLKKELNDFIAILQTNMTNTLQVIESYKVNEFEARIQADSIGERKRLNDGVNSLGNMLKESQGKIQTVLKDKSIALNSSAKKLQSSVDHLNSFAKQSETNAKLVSTEMEIMREQIEGTVLKANDMSEHASKSLENVQVGEVLADKTALAMQEIDQSTGEINNAIIAIDSIAFQTNILSLNAAVEAATAGEAGKGFAVVASEVRTLASKSAEAAKVIKELVQKTQERANEGISVSKNMKENFAEVKSQIQQTTTLVASVSDEANREMEKVSTINELINESNNLIHQNTLIAKDTDKISNEIFQISQDLAGEVSQKQVEKV